MNNNAHLGETHAGRLKRFENGPPYEVISTLLNSMANYFNNEIKTTIENNNYQSSLLFMGIHAAALTISEAFFDKGGPDGYKLFLENFIDGNTADTKFSTIADLIHDWRNVLAHQWLGSTGHVLGYDYGMTLGWEIRGGVTFINPKIYAEHYLSAFGSGGKIWGWESLLNPAEIEDVKKRLIKKYITK